MLLQTFTHFEPSKMGGSTGREDDENNSTSVPTVVDVSFGKGTQVSSSTVLKSTHVLDLMDTTLPVLQPWCATACTSGVLKVWDLATGICRCTCIHPAGITKVRLKEH